MVCALCPCDVEGAEGQVRAAADRSERVSESPHLLVAFYQIQAAAVAYEELSADRLRVVLL